MNSVEHSVPLEHLFEIFEQASSFIAVLIGPNHVYHSANYQYRKIMGGRPLIGKAVREAAPDAGGQGFFELLDQVYTTGKPYIGRNIPFRVQSDPSSPPEDYEIDLLYSAMLGPDGKVFGIFVEGRQISGPKATIPRTQTRLTDLTPREKEVLQWAAAGKTAEDTALILSISHRTVEFHLRSASVKLDTVNRVHTVAEAMRKDLI